MYIYIYIYQFKVSYHTNTLHSLEDFAYSTETELLIGQPISDSCLYVFGLT